MAIPPVSTSSAIAGHSAHHAWVPSGRLLGHQLTGTTDLLLNRPESVGLDWFPSCRYPKIAELWQPKPTAICGS